jgi:predicted phage terminase large subunit-like protein
MATEEERARAHLARIATPSRIAMETSMQFMGRQWNPYPWLLEVERQVIAMLQRPGREVMIISVPPQEGKTTYCGMFLPCWYLGMNPDNLVIFVAYNDEYASSWGVKCRTFMEQYGQELFGVGMDKSQQAQSNWRTNRGFGGMLSAGIGGGITGNPGHFIIIDDVIKNMEEALSVATKRKHLGEWDGSISARFQEDTKVLITATRWSEDDLSGEIWERTLAEDYDGIPVNMIKIKAIAEPDDNERLELTPEQLADWRDLLGRREGESLQGQHSPGFFAEKKKSIGGYTWSTLYQASPTSLEGSMFPREQWRWFDPEDRPRMSVKMRVWDLAASKGEGDWSCGALVGKDFDGNYYILDVQRFQESADEVLRKVVAQAHIDGWGVPIRIEEERAGAGKSVAEFYKIELRGRDIDSVRAEGEKRSRFVPYSARQQQNLVRLPRFADGSSPEWVPKFIEEHRQQMADGRGPKHDDQIDTCAYAVLEMMDRGVVEILDQSSYGVASEEAIADRLADMGYARS